MLCFSLAFACVYIVAQLFNVLVYGFDFFDRLEDFLAGRV